MTQQEVQSKTKQVMEEAGRLLSVRPNDNDLVRVQAALNRIDQMISRHWPLNEEDRRQINIGIYAIRVLEGGPYGALPDMLMELDTELTKAQ
jgi:hypothetical protein